MTRGACGAYPVVVVETSEQLAELFGKGAMGSKHQELP